MRTKEEVRRFTFLMDAGACNRSSRDLTVTSKHSTKDKGSASTQSQGEERLLQTTFKGRYKFRDARLCQGGQYLCYAQVPCNFIANNGHQIFGERTIDEDGNIVEYGDSSTKRKRDDDDEKVHDLDEQSSSAEEEDGSDSDEEAGDSARNRRNKGS